MSFETYLEKYAELAVKVGVNLQPDQRFLILNPPPETAPLVRAITKVAYQAGARHVGVLWHDDQLRLLQLQHGSPAALTEFPTWTIEAMRQNAEEGGAQLSIQGRNPDLFAGQDAAAIQTMQRTMIQHMEPVGKLATDFVMNWSVIGVAVPGWAKKVFPDLPTEEAVAQLWDAIFEVCRIKEADPVASWEQHIAQMAARTQFLTDKAYRSLRYRAPETDLTLGLPAGHRWVSGRNTAKNGVACVPNLPTEEIFTLPHKDQAEGIVTATKPLVYQGITIEGLTLKFEQGRVTEAHATRGESELQHLINTDEGAARLGEVALVPHSSPISKRGVLFYNMLYDENASCHLALGRAYRLNLPSTASDETFAAAGGNTSLIHIDFMMGSEQLDIDGLRADGTWEPIFRAGEWAL